jgi:glycosyltransferase involved in cell wall biosynthesis
MKTLYIHGRPAPHPLHAILADSIDSTFYPVDKYFRWQDKKQSLFFRVFSSVVNAFFYPFHKYDCVLVDNLHIAPIIRKKIDFLCKKKIGVHLGSHTLFFLYTNQYSSLVAKIHLWALKNYDFLICEGEMAKELVYLILPDFKNKVYVSFLGPKHDRNSRLRIISPNLETNKILLIAHGPGEFRKHYKGLDIMINAFIIACKQNNNIKLEIIGLWDEKIINECLKNTPIAFKQRISFLGKKEDVENELRTSSLYIHCSRGDAFPTSTIEAMAAGIPTLVSNWTGTKQLVHEVDDNFVVNLNETDIAEKIIWFFSLNKNEKIKYSNSFRNVSLNYTEELAVKRYKVIFENIKNDM